jgi:transglutaminase-like putative cysteine protease
MTAGAVTAPARSLGDGFRRVPLRPAEGWLTLLATALMTVVFAGSLVDAGWMPASAGDSGFLIYVSLVGLAFGVAGAKLGWGRWRTHFIGALFGGLLLPLIMGGIVIGEGIGWDPNALAQRLVAALGVMQHVYSDLVVLSRPFTSQYAHYHLVFGILVWGAGMLAGYTVFGHRRPLDAIVVLGLAILANMALTSHNQLTLLVLFSAGALLLLIRTHVFEEEVVWARRKIGDPAAVGQLYLRGGAAFVTAAVVGSILLTATASSAPLQGLWEDLPRHLQSASQWLQRFAPPGGDFRGIGIVGFGQSATTSGLWQPSEDVAFRAQIPPIQQAPEFKWRAGTYAEYTTSGWDWGLERREAVAARDQLSVYSAGDEPTPVGRREISFRVIPDAFRDPTILAPNTIQSVDRAADAVMVGADGWFTTVEATESYDSYNVSAMVPVLQDVQGGLTEARLRLAGTDYPADLEALYTALPEGALGPASTALLETIRAQVTAPPNADDDNAYDLARTMEAYLRSNANFEYSPDVRDLRTAQCAGLSTVECFAIIRTGYCEYYASTMAVLLREAGVPARVVYGFLPGERAADGTEVVGAWAAHWWVEVYFPGEIDAWVEFDPTGGGVGQARPLPSGSVGPPTARPGSIAPATVPPEPTERGGDTTNPTNQPGAGVGPFIAIALILAIGVAALAFASYRRTPNRPMHPDQAWGSLARLATRFGLGPRPSQTVYEYAGALGEAVPAARVELTTIARAKVEVAYGKRDLGNERLRRIAEAYHRLRFAILGVVVRRLLRRGKR